MLNTCCRYSLAIIIIFVTLLLPVSVASADDTLPKVVPILVPRVPPPVPNPKQISPTEIFNNLKLPQPSLESLAFNLAPPPAAPGVQKTFALANTLFTVTTACLDFDNRDNWRGDVWSDQFAGWGAFAVDDGGFYHAANVVFSMERTIKGGNFSAKISGDKPYAAGLASPLIRVNPGDEVTVTAKYFIHEHNQGPYDWSSLGVKPDAYATTPLAYKNGYIRNKWTSFSRTVLAESNDVMVLLQASSPRNLNSNIYFDDVEIFVNGKAIGACKVAQ